MERNCGCDGAKDRCSTVSIRWARAILSSETKSKHRIFAGKLIEAGLLKIRGA